MNLISILICGLPKHLSLSTQLYLHHKAEESSLLHTPQTSLADWLMLFLFLVVQLGLFSILLKLRAQFKRSNIS